MISATDAAAERLQWLAEDSPDAWRLARLASLAVRIEPNLLRRLRTTLLPEADVGVEADLWFSAIIESRGVNAIVLEAGAATLLREDLAADTALFEAAYAVLREAHAHLAPALALEEHVNYLALRGGPDALNDIDAALRSAIRAMTESADRAGEIARWVLRAWPRLHETARSAPAAATLALASSALLRRRAGPDLETGASLRDLSWILPPGDFESWVELSVAFADGILHFIESPADATPLVLPDTKPPLAEIRWSAGGASHVRVVDASVGRSVELGEDAAGIRIASLAGDEYELGTTSAEATDSRWLDIEPFADVAAACGRVAVPAQDGETWMTAFFVTREWLATAAEPFRGFDRLRFEPSADSGGATVLNAELPGNVLILVDDDGATTTPVSLVTTPVAAVAKAAANVQPDDQAAVVLGHADGELRGLAGLATFTDPDAREFHVVIESDSPVPDGFIGGPVIIDGMVRGLIAGINHSETGPILKEIETFGTSPARGQFASICRVIGSTAILEAIDAVRNFAAERAAGHGAEQSVAQSVAGEFEQKEDSPAGGRFAKVVVAGDAGAGKSELIRSLAGPSNGQRMDDHVTFWWPASPSGPQNAIVLYESNGDTRWPTALDLEHASLAIIAVDAVSDPAASAQRWSNRIHTASPELPVLIVGTKGDDSSIIARAGRELDALATAEEKRTGSVPSGTAPRVVSAQRDSNMDSLRSAIHARIDWNAATRVDPSGFELARRSAGSVLSGRDAVIGGRVVRPGDPSSEWLYDVVPLTGERTANGIFFLNPAFFEQVVLAVVESAARRPNDVPAARIDDVSSRWSDFASRWKQLEELEIGARPIVLAVAAELQRFGLAFSTEAGNHAVVVLPYMFEQEFPPPDPPNDEAVLSANWTGEARDVFAALVVRFAYEQGRVRIASWDAPSTRGVASLLDPELHVVASGWGSTAELTVSAQDRHRLYGDRPIVRWLRETLESILSGNASLTIREQEGGSFAS